ncbi:aldehyde dehydrogenase family protein [Motiliproteus coralliicola]|uniref:Aldehyde dehydrogenase family protein n=1 Tax=Motiliproteus coralliicola TaxID=2283196 RepID=A0A369WQN1_9GAMM|nr:aldehyde dehydrogenase family protein [Motiliproteus coralliicola]RDE24398.1 aldehyde dehydrogenase family protein [Motiliproteus coralliicola]
MSETNAPRFPLLINGQRCEPSNGHYADVINPATGQPCAQIAHANADDVDRAVAAARAAFNDDGWRDMHPQERSKVLYAIANKIIANAMELAELEVTCSGGTISRVTSLDIPAVADLFMTLAEEVKSYPFVQNLPPRPLPEPWHSQVVKEPIGVCGLITAWNFPILLFCMKVAPALAAGNTVVIKAAESTPTSTLRLAELIAEVVPNGVINVVSGRGSVVGEAMSLHPDVDKISFTGSTSMGKHVQRNAAGTLKRVTVELGGKGPAIVMPDANLDLVAYGALFGVYLNAGQACESGTRLLVHDSVYDQLVERLVAVSGQIVVGNPMDPATSMGPMTDSAHGESVLGYVQSALDEGARVACGGKRLEVAGCEGGFFVEPTVLVDMTNQMKAAREEIFGPVLSVIRFSDADEAIAMANDSDYGLSAGIWTEDLVNAQLMARKLRAGSVWINDWHMMRTDAPFGGYKQSGYGREFGKYSIDSYVETKAINTAFQRNPRLKPLYPILHKCFDA